MAEGETVYSFILQPKKRTVWVCRGKPCRSRYTPLEFGEALQGSGIKPIQQKLFKGKRRSFVLDLLRFDEKAFPVG
jgi:hypothetical protein